MQLSMFTDYALRVMVHLASAPDQLLTTRHISEIHGAKYNHMSKVTGWLVANGYALALRGRGGGLRLAQDPKEVNLGILLRALEQDKPLVDCFSASGGECCLSASCGLSIALGQAQEAFFAALDPYDLASVMQLAPGMTPLLQSLHKSVEAQKAT